MSEVAKKVSATRRSTQSLATTVQQVHPKISHVNRSIAQTKKVSSPNDPAEHEADRTASQVMNMNIPANTVSFVPTSKGGVFRQIDQRPDKEKLNAKLNSPYIARFAGVSLVSKTNYQTLNKKAAPEQEEIQRQPEEEMVQRQEEEEVQRQPEEEVVQRQQEEEVQRQPEEEMVQRQEEEEVQRQPEEEMVQRREEEEVQRQPEEEVVQRQEEEEVQRQPEEEVVQRREEEEVQRQPEEEMVQRQEEEEVQRQPEEEMVQRQQEEEIQRQPEEEPVQRKATTEKDLPGNVSADINSAKSTGKPLPLSMRKFMEPRFDANFSNVRIHTGERAAQLNKQVSAKAFATGNHIFFGEGQFQPETDQGKELLAHELTHTIQQGAAVQRKQAAPSITQTSSNKIQRLGISDALDYFADKAHHIPGFRMFTIVLGVNPINMSNVDRSPANIMRAVVEFMPGGHFITQALDNHGVFDRASTWVAQQIETLGMVGASIRDSVMNFLDSLSWRDIFRLGSVWRRAKRIFTDPITRIKRFVKNLVSSIIQMIKDAILRPLGALAKSTIGEQNYTLLTSVLSYDPITNDSVARSPGVIIGGFMRLIGQEEVWNNIQRANALPRVWAWFQGALSGVIGFVMGLPGRFLAAFRALTIEDIILIPRAVAKIIGVFGSFVGNFISWAGGKVLSLLQIIFEVVAPGVMPFIRKARGAFKTIIQNPIGFIGNLIRAGKLGFQRFAGKFLQHLKASLIGWLTGTMAGTGVYIPQGFNLREIVKFILSVMGLTWQNIRTKLVKVIGETAVSAMERGFEIVKTLVTEGPAAAWQQIVASITNLKDMIMEQIMSFVNSKIVQAAITKLISFLTPAGAFIQAIISIYNTIMFFVERLRQIGQVVVSFVNSIAAIAAGQVGRAAARVERTLAGLLTLVVSFLARFAGLGRVSDAVKNIINKIREPIDKALDKVVNWIVTQARRLGRFVAQAGVPQDPNERLQLAKKAALNAVNRFAGKRVGDAILRPLLSAIRIRYGLSQLDVVARSGKWFVVGVINPNFDEASEALTPDAIAPQEGESAALVGEGNFSFALSIATQVTIGGRLVASDFIVQERKSLKKSSAEQKSEEHTNHNIEQLKALGVEVVRQVNATDPKAYPSGSFDTIVFNHPLVLTKRSEVDEDGKSVTRASRGGETANRQLIKGFLSAAKQNLVSGGKIVIISSHYRLRRWRLDEMAESLGLEQKVMTFLANSFPGYTHERTERAGGAETVQTTQQFAVVFTVKASKSE